MVNSTLFSTFRRNGPLFTPKQALIKGKVSTIRSDEESIGPGPTLSFHITQFDHSWPDLAKLAMIHRLISLKTASAGTAGLNVVA